MGKSENNGHFVKHRSHMQKTVKMTRKGKISENGQVNRIFMNLKKKLNPVVVLTLSCGYIHVYDLYSETSLLVYISDLSR